MRFLFSIALAALVACQPSASAAPEGAVILWLPDGSVRIATMFHAGIEDGERREWFADGTPKASGLVVRGERCGVWSNWHRNGRLRATTQFVHDVEEGIRREYFEDGSKRSRAQIVNGLQHGRRILWDRRGRVLSDALFVRGVEVVRR